MRLPEAYIELIDELVRTGIYPSRSEVIRIALRDFLRKEIEIHKERMRVLRKQM